MQYWQTAKKWPGREREKEQNCDHDSGTSKKANKYMNLAEGYHSSNCRPIYITSKRAKLSHPVRTALSMPTITRKDHQEEASERSAELRAREESDPDPTERKGTETRAGR